MWSRHEISNHNKSSGDKPLLSSFGSRLTDPLQSDDLKLKLAMLQCKRQLMELESRTPRRPLLGTPSQYSFGEPPQSYSPPAENSRFFKGSPGALLQAPGIKRPVPSPWDDFPQDRYDGPSWPKKPANQRPSLIDQPPSLMGPGPSLLGEPPTRRDRSPPLRDRSPPRMVPPPLMSLTSGMGKPVPLMSQTSLMGQPPSLMSQPLSLMSQPLPLMGQLPSLMDRFTHRMDRTSHLMDQPRPLMRQQPRRPPPIKAPKPKKAAKPKQGNTVSKAKDPSALNEAISKTVAWVEQAVGSIVRAMKDSLGSAEPHSSTFNSNACERALKQNIRERVRAVIVGKTLNTCAEIVPLYRNEYPEETDVKLLLNIWEANKQRGDRDLIIDIIQKDNPEIYFKHNFNRVLDAKLNEMFTWIAERYKDIPECNNTAQEIIDRCLLEAAEVDTSEMCVDELQDFAYDSEPKYPKRITSQYYKRLLDVLLQRNMPVLLLKYKKVLKSIFTADEAYRDTMGFLIETTKQKLEKCQNTTSDLEKEICQHTPSDSEKEICQKTPSNLKKLEKHQNTPSTTKKETIQKTPSNSKKEISQNTPSNSKEITQKTPLNSKTLGKDPNPPSNSKEKCQNTLSTSKKEIIQNTPSNSEKEKCQNTRSTSKEIIQNTPSNSEEKCQKTPSKLEKCQNTPSNSKEITQKTPLNSKTLGKDPNPPSNSKEKCQNTLSTSKKEIIQNTPSNSEKEKCQNTRSTSKEIIQNTPSNSEEKCQKTPSKLEKCQNTPSNTTPTGKDPVKKDDWFVKIVACPSLPDPNQMKKFLNPFNPVSIRKHKSMANTLFVKFGTEKDYINIINQTEAVVGTSTLDIKAGQVINKSPARKKDEASDQLNNSQE